MGTHSDPKTRSGWRFDNSYACLPAPLFTRVAPTPVRQPAIVVLNRALAEELGLDPSALLEHAEIFTGNAVPPGADPLAQAYAGHQFGHFASLGDGRAILLGEQIAPGGGRFDIQLKGSGRTPYSRRGDGRAALGPMLREYIVSEAMHALGIPTTRSLAVATTGEVIMREQPLPGAVLTRVAASHIRVGTFEHASSLGDAALLRTLVDHTLARHYPERLGADNRALALLEGAAERQAQLIARWMLVGFVHGVMNTDNMALSGETIDYGPCAFLDTYDPATVFSSIDQHGRYAYANQPPIAQWNLARLAESLLPVLAGDADRAVELAETAVENFGGLFRRAWLGGLRAKLGLVSAEPGDEGLINQLFRTMQEERSDFTATFTTLTEDGTLPTPFTPWMARWRERVTRQAGGRDGATRLMRSVNPVVIPRNHRVEEALTAACRGDVSVMERLVGVLSRPYGRGAGPAEFRDPPPASAPGYRTFCGT